jgi:hypothetical protein
VATALRTLEIDATDLDNELSKQAASYLYVAEQAIEAEAAYKEYKANVDILEAQLSAKAREELEARGKKPTEKMVESVVASNAHFIAAHKKLNELWGQKEVMKAQREAWYMRKDLLIQVAIKQRCEIESMMSSTVKSAAV